MVELIQVEAQIWRMDQTSVILIAFSWYHCIEQTQIANEIFVLPHRKWSSSASV
jgi:hypothetical protein